MRCVFGIVLGVFSYVALVLLLFFSDSFCSARPFVCGRRMRLFFLVDESCLEAFLPSFVPLCAHAGHRTFSSDGSAQYLLRPFLLRFVSPYFVRSSGLCDAFRPSNF